MTDPTSGTRSRRVGQALLDLAADTDGPLPPYLRRHLSAHVAHAELWLKLADTTRVIDALDLDALTTSVTSNLFGRAPVPIDIAAAVTTRPLVDSHADPLQRQVGRAVGRALLTQVNHGIDSFDDIHRFDNMNPLSECRIAGQPSPLSIPLTGHTTTVASAVAMPLKDGRMLLATGSDDAAVRLWDPATGTPVGDPLTSHSNTSVVVCLAAVRLRNGRVLLAIGTKNATVRLWDPATGTSVGGPLTGHTSWVACAAAVPLPDVRVLLATGSWDETVRLWDPVAGISVGNPLAGHTSGVDCMGTQARQLTVDPAVPPGGVLHRQPLHQRPHPPPGSTDGPDTTAWW